MASPDTSTGNDTTPEITSDGRGVSTLDAQSAIALACEMADVAAAMFGLLLLQSPSGPIHRDVASVGASEPLRDTAPGGALASPLPPFGHPTVSGGSVSAGGPASAETPASPPVQSGPSSPTPVPALTAGPPLPAPSPMSPPSIAVPAAPVAIPVPVLVGEPAAEDGLSADTSGEEQRPTDDAAAAAAPVAVAAPVAPRTMAMLNEIAFLDD